MTDEHQALATDLLQRAVDGTDEPSRAASLLVSAAATILQRHFGEERAIELLHHGLDAAGAEWRRGHAHDRPHPLGPSSRRRNTGGKGPKHD